MRAVTRSVVLAYAAVSMPNDWPASSCVAQLRPGAPLDIDGVSTTSVRSDDVAHVVVILDTDWAPLRAVSGAESEALTVHSDRALHDRLNAISAVVDHERVSRTTDLVEYDVDGVIRCGNDRGTSIQ